MGIGGEAMSWEAIRCISKMTEQELWHPRRTERPVLLNRITNAAEEAIKLLAERDRAVELLRKVHENHIIFRETHHDRFIDLEDEIDEYLEVEMKQ